MGQRTRRWGALGLFAGMSACSGGIGGERGGGTFGGLGDDDDGQSFVAAESSSGVDGDPSDPDECPVGEEGCACNDDGRCFEGLRCDLGLCWPPGGDPDDPTDAPDDPSGDPMDPGEEPPGPDCGNGVVEAGEGCDDANEVDDDACSNDCVAASCGNGVVDGSEECDVPGATNGDHCLPTCVFATCGDGHVESGVEACDVPGSTDGDACKSDCSLATCGDGDLYAGGEDCDDGNQNDGDDCPADCSCDAGIIDFDEEVDILGWGYDGDWRLYTQTPSASGRPVVAFDSPAFGTDGNRQSPYVDDSETEVSSATSPSFVLPSVLRFRSWHDDEGATHWGDVVYDNKRVLVRVDGGQWELVVDCYGGPRSYLAMCPDTMNGLPTAADWQEIAIDLGAFAGQMGQIRFEYDTGDAATGLERGWYVDRLQIAPCG